MAMSFSYFYFLNEVLSIINSICFSAKISEMSYLYYLHVLDCCPHLDCYICNVFYGGAHSVMVIVVGNGHGDTSSNPARDWLHFTLHYLINRITYVN